jgi:hypothetical protein
MWGLQLPFEFWFMPPCASVTFIGYANVIDTKINVIDRQKAVRRQIMKVVAKFSEKSPEKTGYLP